MGAFLLVLIVIICAVVFIAKTSHREEDNNDAENAGDIPAEEDNTIDKLIESCAPVRTGDRWTDEMIARLWKGKDTDFEALRQYCFEKLNSLEDSFQDSPDEHNFRRLQAISQNFNTADALREAVRYMTNLDLPLKSFMVTYSCLSPSIGEAMKDKGSIPAVEFIQGGCRVPCLSRCTNRDRPCRCCVAFVRKEWM